MCTTDRAILSPSSTHTLIRKYYIPSNDNISHYVSNRIFSSAINQVVTRLNKLPRIFAQPRNSRSKFGLALARGGGTGQGFRMGGKTKNRKKNGRENIETNHTFDGRKQKYKHKSPAVQARHTDQNLPQRPVKIYAFIYPPTRRSTVNFNRLWFPTVPRFFALLRTSKCIGIAECNASRIGRRKKERENVSRIERNAVQVERGQ